MSAPRQHQARAHTIVFHCKPLRFLLVLPFLTQQALFQSKDCFSVAPAHGKGLEAEYAALGHVGENTAEYGIGVMGNTFDVTERHDEKKMKYLEIGQLAVWLLVSTKHLVAYVHLLHKHGKRLKKGKFLISLEKIAYF